MCLASLVLSYLEIKEGRNTKSGPVPTAGAECKSIGLKTKYKKWGATFQNTSAESEGCTKARGGVLGVFEVQLGRGQDSFCSSLGHCGDHMGKQDEAVTGTLCVVDLDAWVSNGSTLRHILVFKRLDHEETGVFHMF